MTREELERVEKTYQSIGRRWRWGVVSFAGFQGWEPSLRKLTVAHLDLKPGDAVLDVACGRGSNFPYLQRAVGNEGRIVGLDYSEAMLAGARDLVRKKGWHNVELRQDDAAQMDFRAQFDGALCTIAMTVIPGWQDALRGMIAAMRPGKRIAIMDVRTDARMLRLTGPYGRLFARVVAADMERDVPAECRRLLTDVREDLRMFGAYFVISGRGATDA